MPAISLDSDSHAMLVDGNRLRLTNMQYRIVASLLERAGRVVPYPTVLRSAGIPFCEETLRPALATLRAHVADIRGKAGDRNIIRADTRRGYYLDAEVDRCPTCGRVA